MRRSNIVIFASLNPDKLAEFKEILSTEAPDVELVAPQDYIRNAEKLRFVEIYKTYVENAAAKARLANHGAHYPALADDSGLEVQALEGAPGVFSQRYAKPAAGKFFSTRAEQDRANMEKLLTELKKTSGPKTARFVTTLALSIEGITLTATGTLEGTIIDAPRGTEGFGYDPIFVPQGQTKTLAEMSHQEKNAISHRRKAVQELMAQMKSRGIIFAKP